MPACVDMSGLCFVCDSSSDTHAFGQTLCDCKPAAGAGDYFFGGTTGAGAGSASSTRHQVTNGGSARRAEFAAALRVTVTMFLPSLEGH